MDGEVGLDAGLGKLLLDDVLRFLNLRGERAQIVLSVEVEVHAMVTESLHVIPAAGYLRAVGVGWTHVSRPHSNDVVECHLVLEHLRDADCIWDKNMDFDTTGFGSEVFKVALHLRPCIAVAPW